MNILVTPNPEVAFDDIANEVCAAGFDGFGMTRGVYWIGVENWTGTSVEEVICLAKHLLETLPLTVIEVQQVP